MRPGRLEEFFQEDNGQLSSMRLAMLFAVLVLVPGFLAACVVWPHMIALAAHVFLFAASLVGIKAAQKNLEEPKPQ